MFDFRAVPFISKVAWHVTTWGGKVRTVDGQNFWSIKLKVVKVLGWFRTGERKGTLEGIYI